MPGPIGSHLISRLSWTGNPVSDGQNTIQLGCGNSHKEKPAVAVLRGQQHRDLGVVCPADNKYPSTASSGRLKASRFHGSRSISMLSWFNSSGRVISSLAAVDIPSIEK
jgi:hypothetical protein